MAFDREEKQIDIALTAVKQQLTLSATIVTATFAFTELIKTEAPDLWVVLPWILIPLGVNILCGVFVLLSIAYYVVKPSIKVLDRNDVRVFGMLQNFSFIFAIGAMICFLISQII
ncbi:hypothetical protein [Flagellimonas sp.]|uniref:hypothetical protein n=1 Tax=Flagellimonas sp. TaxID=2058762 RepID=UPI003B5215D8